MLLAAPVLIIAGVIVRARVVIVFIILLFRRLVACLICISASILSVILSQSTKYFGIVW